mmetsp:Transcript_9482/g.31433  ORF Transcript_9482/g.31433 Transcript_9482/m.31433 type:complete len:216 (+) Transcript_9482:760-1407(+)
MPISAVTPVDDARACVDVLDHKDEVREGAPTRRLAADDVEGEVVHDVGELRVCLHLRERDVDDRAARVVGERLDERGFARARRSMEQEAHLLRKARDGILARAALEVGEQPQKRVLLWEEERREGLVVRERVPLVTEVGQLVIRPAALESVIRHHRVQPPSMVFEPRELALVPVERGANKIVDPLGAVLLSARQLEDQELVGLVARLLLLGGRLL